MPQPASSPVSCGASYQHRSPVPSRTLLLDIAGTSPLAATHLSLRTERLVLRDFEDADKEPVRCFVSDPEVVRYMEWGPWGEEETESFIRRAVSDSLFQPRRRFQLAVVLTEEERVIGRGEILLAGPLGLRGTIGYVLDRHYWGSGYGTEVAEALVAFGFAELGAHRIVATCDTRNGASIRVLEKIRMRREAHFRRDRWQKGEWRDSFLYAALENEWCPA